MKALTNTQQMSVADVKTITVFRTKILQLAGYHTSIIGSCSLSVGKTPKAKVLNKFLFLVSVAGARFSKDLETFRANKANLSYLRLKNREVYSPETLYEGNHYSYQKYRE